MPTTFNGEAGAWRASAPVRATLVYDGEFDLTGAAAVSHIARSDSMVDDKPEQALAEAREAVALTPNNVRAHISLGRALAKTGHPEEARYELRKALALANADRAFYPLQIEAANDELRKLRGVIKPIISRYT